MPPTLTELKQFDIDFFESVKRDRVLQDAFTRHGFSRFDIHGSQHNAVFVITNAAWDIPHLPDQARRLSIHFEARRRNEFRIEIGLNPYIGNVEQKPDLHRELKPVLQQKELLLGRLRLLLSKPCALPLSIQADTSSLLSPDKIKSHTIVKFTGDLPQDPTPAQTAPFLAQVIDAVAPLVEHALLLSGCVIS